MQIRNRRTNSSQAVILSLGLWAGCTLASAQTISNPSFEANSFTVYPGYISVNNTNIIGWTTSNPGAAGLNPASGNPFADNGAVPDGTNVAFIQSITDSSLSTVISNLIVGETYKVNFRVNARSFGGTIPNLNVWIGASNIINSAVTPVGAVDTTNPYQYFAFDFTAAATNQTMTLSNDDAGDDTVLLDNFSIALRNSRLVLRRLERRRQLRRLQ